MKTVPLLAIAAALSARAPCPAGEPAEPPLAMDGAESAREALRDAFEALAWTGRDAPEDRGAAGLWQALLRLRTTASALHVTAHPDDEDAGVLCLLARGQGARTGLLSLTRGEGGANLITADFFDQLSLLRTLELLEADRRYGVEQHFTRAADYGFSKTVDEALRTWGGEEEILRDAVRVIRRERPDVVFARFRGDARDGHGHHTLSGRIARLAFEAAADPARFPEQIAEGLRPWLARKLYHGNVSPDRPEDAGSPLLAVDPGVRDPLLGRSYHQIAREGYSFHRSQGMMAPPSTGGPRPSRYKLVESRVPGSPPEREESFFDGIDCTIAGLARFAGESPPAALSAGLRALGERVEEAVRSFDARAPEKTAASLARAWAELARLESSGLEGLSPGAAAEIRLRLGRKRSELVEALAAALGLEVEARVKAARGQPSFARAVPGQAFAVEVSAANGGKLPLRVLATAEGACRPANGPGESPGAAGSDWKDLGAGGALAILLPVTVDDGARPTRPHWARGSIEETLYRWSDPASATRALPRPPLAAGILIAVPSVEGAPALTLAMARPVRIAVEEPKRGVRLEPVSIAPAVSVRFPASHGVVPVGKTEYRLAAIVRSDVKGAARGSVRLEAPPGWSVEPPSREFAFAREGEEAPFEFTLRVPAAAGQPAPAGQPAEGAPAAIEAVAAHEGREYREGFVTVTAPEVGRFDHYRPARHLVRVTDVRLPPDLRLAYVMGSGDDVPGALALLGLRPEMLGPADLAGRDLSGFDAVLIGVRAYAVRPDLKASNGRLLDYVRGGGVVIVQYQTPEFDEDLGPYPYRMTGSPEEVSEEDAPVEVLEPASPLFRAPNPITARDFDGWVEERGSKFWKSWDARYTALLECHDHGQEPQRGGLLFARHGKGAWVYCAYAFYRQLPHGVPGAYRLFANLISLRRTVE